jgi:hypothetical protein
MTNILFVLASLLVASASTTVRPSLITPRSPKIDTIGLYNLGRNQYVLRNSNTYGFSDLAQNLGAPGDLPFTGDFDADGRTDLGAFRPSTGEFFVLMHQPPFQDFIAVFNFVGREGDRPIAGDWDGDGFDTVGVYRDDGEAAPIFFLTNAHLDQFPKVDLTFEFGTREDRPIAGDWDGDGIDTVGVYRPGRSTFLLVNDYGAGVAVGFTFGLRGDRPFAGDWNGDGADGVGVYRPDEKTMHLTDDFGETALEFGYRMQGDVPVAGDWDNQ